MERKYWRNIFDRVYEGQIDTWDYSWIASTWCKGGLTATPNVNLVSNIGFGDEATHTTDENNKFSKMPVGNLGIIKHPKIIDRNIEADKWTFDYHFGGKYHRFPYSLIRFTWRIIKYIYFKLK